MKYNAVIFDLDGTLLDTLEDLADSMNAALQRYGFPTHPTDAYRTFVGDGVQNLVLRSCKPANDDQTLAEKLVDAMRQEYHARWDNKSEPYDGVDELLTGLEQRNVPAAILSNKPHDFTKRCVKELLGEWNFSVVQGVNCETPPKPDPKGALRTAGTLNVQPEEVLYVGDTNTDMKTAQASRFYAVGATWGFRTPEELRENGADVLVDKPQDILDLLGE